MTSMADDPPTNRLPCGNLGCRRRARYFGAFAGGVCRVHALEMVAMFPESGLSQFWPQYRDDLRRG